VACVGSDSQRQCKFTILQDVIPRSMRVLCDCFASNYFILRVDEFIRISTHLPYYTVSIHNAYCGNEQITEEFSVEDLTFKNHASYI
jgi:hypothetical protein